MEGWFRRRYDGVSPATWSRELATLRSAIRWWRAQGWLAENPTGGLARRREVPDRTRALTYRQVETLWRRDVPLREKTLWRLLYETAARTGEILALDVADLDVANKRARVRSKGGGVGVLADRGRSAATPTARRPGCRPGVPGRLGTHPRGRHRRPRPGHRPGPAVLPQRRRGVHRDDRVDAAPAAALRADPRGRGRRQPGHAAGPVPAHVGAQPRALRRRGRTPSPTTSPSVTRPGGDADSAGRLTRGRGRRPRSTQQPAEHIDAERASGGGGDWVCPGPLR